MEYLMTYGWAILIIAVVLGALFSLGVFNSGALLGNSCVAGPGYLCSSPIMDVNGNFMMTFGQSTGSAIYNVGMACAATSTSTGLPSPATSMMYLTAAGAANGLPANAPATGLLSLMNGQTVSVSGVKCYNSAGTALMLATSPIGTAFSGSIWINFTLASGASGGTNPVLTAKIASVTAKVA